MTIAFAPDESGTTTSYDETCAGSQEYLREELAPADRSILSGANAEAKKCRFGTAEGEEPRARSEDRSPPLVGHAHKGLILFVDDEKFIRQTVSAVFARAGYRVITAVDGASAAAIFVKHAAEIQLVITDSDMPVVNGEALGQIVRGFSPATKILSISGYPHGLRCSGVTSPACADAFLPKPFNPQALLDTVAGLLRDPVARDFARGGAARRRGETQR